MAATRGNKEAAARQGQLARLSAQQSTQVMGAAMDDSDDR
jgi:hypothetical protein